MMRERRPTAADLIASLPPSGMRDRVDAALSGRLKRAEMPPLDGGPAEIVKIKQEIALDLAPYEAMHVLACLMSTQAFKRKGVYSELDDESAATIEYVASILLERPSPHPSGEPAPPPTMSRPIQRTLDRTRGITMQAIWVGRRRRDEAASPLDAVAAEVEVHDAISRWPGYAKQATRLLEDLATIEPVADFLRREVGFDLSQGLQLEDAVGRLLTARFNSHNQRTVDLVNDLEAEFEAQPESVPGPLRARTDAERARRGMWMLAQEQFSERLRDSLLLTAEDLAKEADVATPTAAAFLEALSSHFGDTKGTSLLTGRNVVRKRPFVADEEGRYLLTLPGNLLWGIRPVVEQAIKRDQSLFHIYESARSDYTERETARHLAAALGTDEVWTNVGYWLDGVLFEADVLARIDDVFIVAEVKSGELTGKAWRGRKADLKRDLNALLRESASQSTRLASELQARRVPEFFDRTTRESLRIPVEGIKRVESVVVTLEGLGFVGLIHPLLRDAGILGEDESPWIVSLYDLEVIAGACAHAAQLTSYIRRRRTMDERVEFLDECDLWMLHLRETLDFRTLRGRLILVDGRSDEMHHAWMFDARMPTMKLDKSSKRRLRELDRKRPPGFIAAGEAVIADAQRGRRPRVQAF